MEICNITFTSSRDYAMANLHCHDFFELYFQVAGKRQYFCENKYYALERNTLVVTRPNLLHKYEGGPYERILIGVPLETLSKSQIEFLYQQDKQIVVRFSDDDMIKIRETLDSLLKIQANIINYHSLLFSMTFSYLLYQIFNCKTSTVNPVHILKNESANKYMSPLILKVMDYIQVYYNKPLTYKDLCSTFGISKTWLCKSFMQANGITLFNYKLIIQLNKAKQLLHTSSHNISKIATSLGFSSANYFAKVFKKEFGITPHNYRKSNRENRSQLK